MSCQTILPTGADVVNHIDNEAGITDGWRSFTAVATTALSQYYAVAAEVLEYKGFFDHEGLYQHLEIAQVEVEEEAGVSGNLQKADLQVLIFRAEPAAPSTSAANDPSEANLLAVVEIDSANYKRVSSTVWRAIAKPEVLVTNADNASGSVYIMVLANQSATYVSHANLRLSVRIVGKRHA